MKERLVTILLTLSVAALLAAAGAAIFVYVGIYNIAADRQHTAPVYRLLDYAMRRSVKFRTRDMETPNLNDPQRILNGLAHYRAHCLQCHGAPGIAPGSEAIGMTPAPVNLVSTAREWPAREIYWIVRHGIKMSGMPAWEGKLKDEELWDVVAFVEAMPSMSPQRYGEMSRDVPLIKTPQHVSEDLPGAGVARQDPDKLGDVEAGKRALDRYLCATCHAIPGVVGASRHVGPPLGGIARRQYIAGVLPNTPENMVHWIRHPQQVDPLSAMPSLGVTDQEARDMTAYLYTLTQ